MGGTPTSYHGEIDILTAQRAQIRRSRFAPATQCRAETIPKAAMVKTHQTRRPLVVCHRRLMEESATTTWGTILKGIKLYPLVLV